MTPIQRINKILEECVGSDLTSWERFEFFPSIKSRPTLTEKQEKVLAGIEARVFGDDEA